MAIITKLKGLVGLITGGASGLGKATVQTFVREGAKVVLCDLPSSAGEKLAKDFGENTVFVSTDVTSEKDVKQALAIAEDKFGKLDVAINCAGIGGAFPIYNFNKDRPHNLDDFHDVINVNTIGTFNVTRLAVGLIGQNQPDGNGQRGVVVNTSGFSAYDGQKGQVTYAAAVGAISAMTLPMARDLSSQGIRVNTIAPGLFDTPLLSRMPDEVKEFLALTVPSPTRFGSPEEFAHMVKTVIENPMINGEVIKLDGAFRLQL